MTKVFPLQTRACWLLVMEVLNYGLLKEQDIDFVMILVRLQYCSVG
jgi:hypothetical protein